LTKGFLVSVIPDVFINKNGMNYVATTQPDFSIFLLQTFFFLLNFTGNFFKVNKIYTKINFSLN